MPYYDYKCRNCGKIEEYFHKVDDKFHYFCGCTLTNFMEKQISPVPSHFKGTGFYSTDYQGK